MSNIFIIDEGSRSQPACSLDSESCTQAQAIVPEGEPAPDSGQQNGMCEEQVHVLYLDVPASDEPQVLDLSNLLVHEGIQMTESPDPSEHMANRSHVHAAQEVVIANEGPAKIAMVTGHSEKQSAHALIGLSSSQLEGGHLRVSDILAGHHHSEHIMSQQEQTTSAEALLQLSSDAGTGTYIVDETGTMIPISQMRPNSLIEVDETGVTTIAICQCWCGREFISQDDLDRHKLAHKYQTQGRVTPGLLKCTLCLESFLTNKDLRIHHTEVHPGGMPWECNICHRTFHKKIAMKAHMRVHNTLTRYQCSSCKKIFFYKTALNRHLRMHSCEKPFKCTICGDMYHSLWDLRKHRMNHQPPKLFACDVCTKVFKQKQTLLVHSRIHTGQRPYLCEVCCRSFSLKSTLVQHRRIHTGEKPNICHICQRAFRQNSTLKAHLRTHTCLKPYLCRYCKLRFAYRDEVAEHEHSHAHNKTWQCEECGMWFKNQSLLARHSRVHTNERPFQCTVCCKTFVQSGSLQSHMRSHTKEKPYQCRICSKAYYTSGTLLVHIRKFHNVDAKSVREVFPVYNYIEDQKVFTIRNSLLSDLKPIVTHVEHDETSEMETTNLEDLLGKDNALVEELVETSGEIIVQDSTAFKENIISSVVEKDCSGSSHGVHADVSSGSEHKDRSKIKVAGKERQRAKRVARTNQKNSSEKDAGLGASSGELDGQDDASQSSHAAHDRQEAALGLAELALTGGEGMHSEKQPQTKTRTFFREEEEDERDPNVMKIILSKEGGIMNSQDPHQCSVCGRIFGRKSIMIEHMRIHTDEKPYECDFCQASFRQNAQLRSHIRNNHTQVERYQCSFCHNRFLSHSITVRHIQFHHKLKIKFCQNLDPAWTVDNAVWSDDNFELSSSNAQFVKMNKKSKPDYTGWDDPAPLLKRSPETDHQLDAGQSGETLNKYVVKVSLLAPGTDLVMPSGSRRTAYEQLPAEITGQSSAPSATREGSHDVFTMVPPVLSGSSGTRSGHNQENQVVASQNQAAPASDATPTVSKDGSRSTGTVACIKAVMGTDFGNSRLLCGTCAMQFRGISSLRYHLRKVHKKSLDQSDVSYLYEGGDTSNSESTGGPRADIRMAKLSVEHSGQDSAENGSVKIVVYDDSKKCADEPSDANMPYGCMMCSRRYSSRVSLEDHLKSHSEEDVEGVGLHRCDQCASVMKNTQQVTKHILKFHGVKQIYICSICNREFFQQSSVYRHMKFLHKWEIKIRGEASIPVFIKPAPSSIHAPSTSSSVLKDRMQSLVQQTNKPVAQLSNCADSSVTYISLDIGDTDNLQIYKSDEQEVIFEVVGSDKTKTVKLEGVDLDSVKIETTAWDTSEKMCYPTTAACDVADNNRQITPTRQASYEDVPDTVTTTAVSMSPPANTITSPLVDSCPLNGADSDTSSKLPISKETISQHVAALTNSSHRSHSVLLNDVCKAISVKCEDNTGHQADAASSDSTNRIHSQNKPTTHKIALLTSEAAPAKKLINLPSTSNVRVPIVMSVKDIGIMYADSNLGNQSMSEMTRKDGAAAEDSLTGGNACLLSITERGSTGEDVTIQDEEAEKGETCEMSQPNSQDGIKDTLNSVNTAKPSKKSSKAIKKRSGDKAIRGSCVLPVSKSDVPPSPKQSSLDERASLPTQTTDSSPSLGSMASPPGNTTPKRCPATVDAGKSGKQAELGLASHSRSGRLIKRKRFDDEL